MSNYTTYTKAETIKLIKATLKQSFPGVAFSVKARGDSVTVSWQDGPAIDKVNWETSIFVGQIFDDMRDLSETHRTVYKGQLSHFQLKYIFTNRTYSAGLTRHTVADLCQKWGIDQIPNVDDNGQIESTGQMVGTYLLEHFIWREMNKTSFDANGIAVKEIESEYVCSKFSRSHWNVNPRGPVSEGAKELLSKWGFRERVERYEVDGEQREHRYYVHPLKVSFDSQSWEMLESA